MYCKICGCEVYDTSRYCKNCGSPLYKHVRHMKVSTAVTVLLLIISAIIILSISSYISFHITAANPMQFPVIQ